MPFPRTLAQPGFELEVFFGYFYFIYISILNRHCLSTVNNEAATANNFCTQDYITHQMGVSSLILPTYSEKLLLFFNDCKYNETFISLKQKRFDVTSDQENNLEKKNIYNLLFLFLLFVCFFQIYLVAEV